MSVDAKLVKTLRERTGAGMMDCKKALVESKGDLDTAVDRRKLGVQARTTGHAGQRIFCDRHHNIINHVDELLVSQDDFQF